MTSSSLVPISTRFWLENDTGTLQHRFTNLTDAAEASLSDTPINLSTTVWQPLADGLTTTAFSAGAKISNSFSNSIIFDTNPQKAGFGGVAVTLVFNSTGTDFLPITGQSNEEVVGVTQRWPLLQFITAPAGMAFVIDTTNIPSGKRIIVDLVGSVLV